MSDDRQNGAAGIVVAFTLGALAGAVVALLFAPAKGDETREMISEKAREQAEKTKAFIRQQKDNLATVVERGREAYQAARGEKEQG
ncbi:MAG: YtxH domain-containing protein [Acidobacteriota bacterium]